MRKREMLSRYLCAMCDVSVYIAWICAGALKKLWLLLLCALSNHQHYWLSELQLNMLMASVAIVCAPALLATLWFFMHPKAYFPIYYVHSHIGIFPKKKHSNISAFGWNEFKLICIFIRISHFNFVALVVFLYRAFSFPLFCALHCSLSSFLPLDVALRIWFPLIGAIIATQSSLWAFKVFSPLSCWMYLFPLPLKPPMVIP